jgi:hypothetical protein
MKSIVFILFLSLGVCVSCKSEISPSQTQTKAEQDKLSSKDSNRDSSAEYNPILIEKNDTENIPVGTEGDKIEEPKPRKIVKDKQTNEKEGEEISSNEKEEEIITQIKNIEEETVQNQEEIGEEENSDIEEKEEPVIINIHDPLDALLKKYVSKTGNVNYAGLKKEESSLDAYLIEISEVGINNNWSRKAKMAFWINAYNAYTIKLILKNYPTSSIMNISGGKAWDVSWIKIGGTSYSLNDIEHKILRPTYRDARIHFAVNCAAKSCPPLYNGAWTESNLETLLNSQTKKFINNKAFNEIGQDQLVLSKIFEWYKEDFGNLQSYIEKYTSIKVNPKAKVKFQEYNWSLNN